jgi:hypothetical protein
MCTLSVMSKPRDGISSVIGILLPICIKAVLSVLQRSPLILENSYKISLIAFSD